jgi:ORMDL family
MSVPGSLIRTHSNNNIDIKDTRTRRRSRSTSIIHEVLPENIIDESDQSALPNWNSSWVNVKGNPLRNGTKTVGAWLIHPVMIISLKILFNSLPGVSQELSWTLTNLTYMASSYLMFHWVKGIPFEFNAGAYDNLNMWEQMDNGDQYTPAKKFLTFVPIVLYSLFLFVTD